MTVFRCLWIFVFASISVKLFAQDPPALKTNQANEAAEPPIQKGSGLNMKRAMNPQPFNNVYGLVEFRHSIDDYYSESGERIRRNPAVHGRLRAGAKFYSEALDMSFGVGGTKLPASQRIYQNRPDITVDFYPVKGRIFNLLTYGNVLFPVRRNDLDPTEFSDGDRYDQDYRKAMDSSVFSFGIAPNMKWDANILGGRSTLILGGDAWTRMYSKPIYVVDSKETRSLQLIDENSKSEMTPFEDRALRYVHQETLAIGYTPSALARLQTEVAGYSESRYLPRYKLNEQTGGWEYTYDPERVSFFRFKATIDLTSSAYISEEVYFFRNGFFAENRVNGERQMRNIVRLAFKL